MLFHKFNFVDNYNVLTVLVYIETYLDRRLHSFEQFHDSFEVINIMLAQ